MQVIVKKWGNSAAVRLPSAIMSAAALKLDETVNIHEENGCIIIEPVRAKEFELAQLLAAITPDNLHTEVSFGAATGKEAL